MSHPKNDPINLSEFRHKRAALYMRSAANEEAHDSIENQYGILRMFVVDCGCTLNLDHIFRDIGYSGASEIRKRPALSQLMAAAERREFDIVCIVSVDRLFRRRRLLLETLDELQKFDIGFVSIAQPEINTSTVSSTLMISLLDMFAEIEHENTIERTRAGRTAKSPHR